jgi:hypothetical protein
MHYSGIHRKPEAVTWAVASPVTGWECTQHEANIFSRFTTILPFVKMKCFRFSAFLKPEDKEPKRSILQKLLRNLVFKVLFN